MRLGNLNGTILRRLLLSVTYEGILKIVDEEKVRKMLIDGIGREKAYGVGLMTLVHMEKGTV